MAAPYRVAHVTAPGRCVWCWSALDVVDTHTAVEPAGGPTFDGRPLRFHHRCWEAYLSVAGPGAGDGRHTGASPEWPPERIERLRIHCGMTHTQFRRRLRCSQDRLFAALRGDERAARALAPRLTTAANAFRFERTSAIDWTRPEAVHSLVLSLGWSRADLAAKSGFRLQTVQRWVQQGVPAQSLRAQNRLGRLAADNGFAGADVVTARPWPAEEFSAAVAASGLSPQAWAGRMGVSVTSVKEWMAGRVPVSRDGAWKITREAARLGLLLPPAPEADPWARAES